MNWLKDKCNANPVTGGIWLSTGSLVAAELAAATGFDWALLDMEHGVCDESDILNQIRILSNTATCPVVRIPSRGNDVLKKVLDYGATAVMSPMINTPEEAEDFVKATKYPPDGTRGMSGSSRASAYGLNFKEYYRQVNQKLTVIAQIETRESIANIEKIAAVDGIDILFIGHSDLSLDLGCFEDYSSQTMLDAEAQVLSAAKRCGKKVGMLLKTAMNIGEYRKKGFSFIALGTDLGCLKSGYKNLAASQIGDLSRK
jgi:2-keto-3-deoxy-L-rhamnonate aldolase RhmA